MKIRSKGTKLDFTATAASVVSQAIGQGLFDGEALPDPNEGKDPAAIERGRKGGEKGGEARAKKLSAKKRSEIAKKAAIARWRKS
jgi:hypothetical protein